MQKHFGKKTKKSLGVLHTSSFIHSVRISKFYSHDFLKTFFLKNFREIVSFGKCDPHYSL